MIEYIILSFILFHILSANINYYYYYYSSIARIFLIKYFISYLILLDLAILVNDKIELKGITKICMFLEFIS